MRAIDVLKNVYLLIDEEFPEDTLLKAQNLGFINHILADLGIGGTLCDLNEELGAEEKLLTAVVYGTAMLLTAAKGDSARQQYFTELYNLKRAIRGSREVREDRIPVSLW